jgi:hypothetical protein
VKVTVPLLLTATVPDQVTADRFHSSVDRSTLPSPVGPSTFATKAQAAAHALTVLVHADALRDIPMPNLDANLHLSPFSYPAVIDANVSIIFPEGSRSFNAVVSPRMDTRALALQAFAEDAAFALEVAVRAVPDLPDSIGVRCNLYSNPGTVHFCVMLCFAACLLRLTATSGK